MTAVARLAAAIGYPDPVREDETVFTLKVDGGEMRASEERGQLVLSRELAVEEEQLPRLAGYAAGRLIKEDAVLAWDPQREAALLWQQTPASSSDGQLKLFFEVFAASCDWWAARLSEENREESHSFPQMMFRP